MVRMDLLLLSSPFGRERPFCLQSRDVLASLFFLASGTSPLKPGDQCHLVQLPWTVLFVLGVLIDTPAHSVP